MKKRAFLVSYGILMLVLLTVLVFCYFNYEEGNKVCFDDWCYPVELADNQRERLKGLRGRNFLPENQGMLFVFDRLGTYSFWMKETLIPLDILWLNQNGEIVYIKENARPCSDNCEEIKPESQAQYVLEINAGEAQKYKLQPGSRATILLK